MQAAASKRALSSLASKLHPQLPLSPRESQQLLTLLTSSFRAHLDREHPSPHGAGKSTRSTSPTARHVTTSYARADQHIGSILSNPLFAVTPRHRAPESSAVDMLRDPLEWLNNEIAKGTITIHKAAMSLELLESSTPQQPLQKFDAEVMASAVTHWLETSDVGNSKSFIEYCMSAHGRKTKFLERLFTIYNPTSESTSWSWFTRPTEVRVKESGLDFQSVVNFRQHLLKKMVCVEASSSLDNGLTTFLRAMKIAGWNGYQDVYKLSKPAGAHLVNRLISTPDQAISPELYQSFLEAVPRWLGAWSPAVESMLWLHHPKERSAFPGLHFIQSSSGAILHVRSSRSRRNFLVQLCLGVARQLLEQDRYADAQIAMNFAKEHFADMVLNEPVVVSQQESTSRRAQKERDNLELLDQLALS